MVLWDNLFPFWPLRAFNYWDSVFLFGCKELGSTTFAVVFPLKLDINKQTYNAYLCISVSTTYKGPG
jgi:hypothetical protein